MRAGGRRYDERSMREFQELGEELEVQWRKLNYDEEQFPDLAAEALKKHDIVAKVEAWDVLRWALEQTELPPQKDPAANFGDPPITLFVSPRFYIDVYFWRSSTTAVHQHSFCGAFQVLHGSSLHSWYEFEPTQKINAFAEIGDMTLKVSQVLKLGDIQKIMSGRRYIHSLFHLDNPSATIVVRTEKSPLHLPQFSYHKPSFAVDPFFEHQTTTKKLQTLSALYQLDRPDADDEATKLLRDSDFQTTFTLLAMLKQELSASAIDDLFEKADNKAERFRRLFDIVREVHGEKADTLARVFEHRDLAEEIFSLRRSVTDPEHRFFMALLLNLEGTDEIFPLLKARYPEDDPLDKALDIVEGLSRTRVVGSNKPNALGVEFDYADLLILEQLLSGQDPTESGHGPEGFDVAPTDLEARITRLREAPVLRPLLA